MSEKQFCQKCSERQSCQQVYQRLGEAQGPLVVRRALLAFLLPMMVFIVVLVVSERLLAEVIVPEALRILTSIIIALSVTSVCMLIIKVVTRRLGEGK